MNLTRSKMANAKCDLRLLKNAIEDTYQQLETMRLIYNSKRLEYEELDRKLAIHDGRYNVIKCIAEDNKKKKQDKQMADQIAAMSKGDLEALIANAMQFVK